jgi:hypothetical protein
MKRIQLTSVMLLACVAWTQSAPRRPADWSFAVSGDSRNCGNVVMPAIAAEAIKAKASFYWHLGDLRAIYAADEDYQHEPEHRGRPISKDAYLETAWDDFIQNQMASFGSMPVFLGIGNHEAIAPKTREQFTEKFAQWLDAPALREQRLADDPKDGAPKTFFHWIQAGVDFIYLDNATQDQFSPAQVSWLEGVLERAAANPAVRTLVVGMHAALPDSLASDHSMSNWPIGTESGRRVYTDLLNFRKKSRKRVYLLASHSHFFMSGIFRSDYWRTRGGELPGWIIGTGGALRYPLPPQANRAREARSRIYGFLLGTVRENGEIRFKFKKVSRGDVPGTVAQRYTPEFVDYCFDKNIAFPQNLRRPAPIRMRNKAAATYDQSRGFRRRMLTGKFLVAN